MEIVQRMDEWGKPAWIAAMVVGFILFWPLGLALLAYLIWSGRMGCKGNGNRGWGRRARRAAGFTTSSGNSAFDEYREETLRRLEEEQREFTQFLEQLRHAKDKAEFDQFMTERRNRPAGETGGAPQADQGRKQDTPQGAGRESTNPGFPTGPATSPA